MKSLLFTLFSLFIIAESAIAQSSGYSNVASGESSKAKETKPSKSDSGKFNDSLKQIALFAEIDSLRKQLKAQSDANQAQIDQLKAKSESNQAQIDQLKVDNARTKIAGTVNRPVDNTLVIGQLKARSDTNQIQIDQLRAELAKEKDNEVAIAASRKLNDSLLLANMSSSDVKLAQLKTKSESNQSQIDQLKVENARTKIAGTVNRPADNSLVIVQLKAQSDSNQTQIAQLKRELAYAKNAETAKEDDRRLKDSSVRHFLIAETDALLTQLKTKADTNQIQFERLKAEFVNAKTAGSAVSSNKENDEVIARLKTKSDAYQVQIDQLKEELINAKNDGRVRDNSKRLNDSITQVNLQAADVKLALLKARSESNQAQIDQLKVDNARTKIAGTITSPNTDNTIVIGQLKAKSDTNQAQIDWLKMELAKVKNVEVKMPPDNDNGALIAQLKTQSDNNQAQIDMLVETITKTREEMPKSADSKKSVAVEKVVLGGQLVEKSNSEGATGKLNTEPEKPDKSVLYQSIPLASEPGAPSYKTDRFVDENGASAGNGFYVVIGTFGNKENAEKFKAANIIKGHRNTKIIQNKATKMYNIFALKTNNKMDADVERAKYKKEYSNVWILKLE